MPDFKPRSEAQRAAARRRMASGDNPMRNVHSRLKMVESKRRRATLDALGDILAASAATVALLDRAEGGFHAQ